MLFLRQLLSNTRTQSLSQKKLEKERYLVKSLNNVREKTSLTDSVYFKQFQALKYYLKIKT